MRYYLGHWQWTTLNGMACYAPPAGVVGCLDLGTLPQMSVGGADRGRLLCWTRDAVTLPSEYELLGVGDCRELNTDGAMLDKFQSLVGYRPQGAKLVDAVWDCLEGGADIDGTTGPLPLVPTTRGNLGLHFAGHSVVKSRRFKWGNDAASPKLKQLLRKEFRGLLQDSKAGKLKDAKHAFRVLDYWCDKYGVSDWREFVPANLQKDVPGRVKHETTITESFDQADSTTLGPDLPWTEIAVVGWRTVSNRAGRNAGTASTLEVARADSDLSSADHYAQAKLWAGNGKYPGVIARVPSSGDATGYDVVHGGTGDPNFYTQKLITGTLTNLNFSSQSPVDGSVSKVEPNGSTISGYYGGALIYSGTDTSISSGVRCGLVQYENADSTLDDFEAADLAAGPSGHPAVRRFGMAQPAAGISQFGSLRVF